jgi:ApaG protein
MYVIGYNAVNRFPRNAMAESKKHDINITIRTNYIAEQSDPGSDRYVFAYTIQIANEGTEAAQLISRHWIITDAENRIQEVRGLGVVGEQPFLRPGETFEYTSGTSLATPVGTMRGTYQMVSEDGQKFDAEIPEFTLSMPRILH